MMRCGMSGQPNAQCEPARTIVYAYLFAFTIGCFANSLLLNFTEGNLFIFLIGIFLSCRRGAPSQAQERL